MAINFPNSPQAGDPHSEAGIDWVYDGEKWVAQSEATFWARTNSTLSPSTAGDNISTTGDLTAGCTTTGSSGSSGEAKVVGYQQGTGTPYFVNVLNAYADGVSAYTTQTMTWARVGNLVTFNLYCEAASVWSFQNGVQGTNFVGINGLPYHMAAGAGSGFPSCAIGYWNKMAWSLLPQDTFAAGNPTAYLSSDTLGPTVGLAYPTYASSGQDVSRLKFSESVFNANSAVQLSGQYITDDTTWTPADGATIS